MRNRLIITIALVCLFGLVIWLDSSETSAQPYIGPRGVGDAVFAKIDAPNVAGQVAVNPDAPISFVLDDGAPERAIGFGNSTSNRSSGAIWLNRFSPGNVPYPLTLDGIYILFPGSNAGNFIGKQILLLIYLDTDADNDPSDASLVYQSLATIQIANWQSFQAFPIALTINTPGDLYVGWEDKWAESGPSPFMYVAAQDTTQSQRRSWLAANSSGYVPNIYNLGSNSYLGVIDSLAGFPGNWMIRLSGSTYDTPTPTPTPTPRCPSERFTDVCPGDFFYVPVLYLNDRGIIGGYTDRTFRPENSATRGQMTKIIVLGYGIEPVNPPIPTFSDVPPGSTFYTFVEAAVRNQIIGGYPDGTFRPGNSVTRGQLSKIVVNAAHWSILNPPAASFNDVPIGSAFYTFVETAVAHHIIGGYTDGTFRPGNQATRGQICKIVYNALTEPTPTPTGTDTPTITATFVPTSTETPSVTETPIGTPTEESTATVTPGSP